MTFLEKYDLVRKSVPVPAVTVRNTINSEYVDFADGAKNCYYCFKFLALENSMYTTLANGNKIVDCFNLSWCEKCYQSIDCNKCHGCTYLIESVNCTNCHFSTFLNSCSDCFGCVALTHKKYCIFNEQYTKEEYFKKVEELKKENPEKILEQMFELKKKIPHPASHQVNTQNCPFGDYIFDSKNCYWGFSTYNAENCGYYYNSGYNTKNCWDGLYTYGNPQINTSCERCYQTTEVTGCYDCAYLYKCRDCTNCYYSQDLIGCTDCFGCVGLTNKKYCILNNQLTKEQYEKAVTQIKKELGWKV